MKILRNFDGFTLIEVLVGMALLGGLAFATMKTFDVQNMYNKTIESKNELEATINNIRQILGHGESCLETLNGLDANPPIPVSIPIPPATSFPIKFKKGADIVDRYIVSPDLAAAPKYGNGTFQITGLRLEADADASKNINIPPNQTQGYTNLILKFNFGDTKRYGVKEIERKIPLRVDIDDPSTRRITRCSSNGIIAALATQYLSLNSEADADRTMEGDIHMADGTKIEFDSDRRLKYDIQAMNLVFPKLKSIFPVTYRWKSSGTKALGFIAQDVKRVFPKLVKTDQDKMLKIDYVQFNPLILKGLQEVDKKSTDLKQEFKQLENDQKEMSKLLEAIK